MKQNTSIALLLVVFIALGVIGYAYMQKAILGDPALPKTARTTGSVGVNPTPPQENNDEPAIIAAKTLAMNSAKLKGLSEVAIVSSVSREWHDGCLGLGDKDEMCAQAIVPGFEIRLLAGGDTYTYHTNKDGTVVREAK